MFDSACIYFRLDLPCQLVGNCWVYNNFQLSWSILAAALISIGANFIFSFLSWLFYPKQNVSGKGAMADQGAFPLTNKTDVGEEVLPEKEASPPAKEEQSEMIAATNPLVAAQED